MTAFKMPAAAGSPTASNALTNGLAVRPFADATSVQALSVTNETHRDDVEQPQPGDEGAHRGADAAARVVGLGRGDRHDLDADEGEHHDRHRQPDRLHTTGHEPAVVGEVSEPGGGMAGHAEQHEDERDEDERDESRHLERGEDDLGAAERAHGEQVDDDDRERHEGDEHGERRLRPPVLQICAGRDDLAAERDDARRPVAPARDVAGPLPEVTPRGGAEAARLGAGGRHLRHGEADDGDEQRAQRIADDGRRAGHPDRRAGTEEQARAERRTETDHQHGAMPEAARQATRTL